VLSEEVAANLRYEQRAGPLYTQDVTAEQQETGVAQDLKINYNDTAQNNQVGKSHEAIHMWVTVRCEHSSF
jgi:hypothetical protein